MKQIYAVASAAELEKYQAFYTRIQSRLDGFLAFLGEKYAVSNLPRAIVWTNYETAAGLINDIPIPAYTNDYRTVFCPDVDVWRSIYLKQLDDCENKDIRNYYESKLTENHVMQILGHEFVHHSELFVDEEYDKGIWFEEGMCEYISRKYFLTDKEFAESIHINMQLVNMFCGKYGDHSLEEFGASTYQSDYANIFYEYWRSFLAIHQIVKQFDGDVLAVFQEYHRWQDASSGKTLAEWFDINI